MAAPTLSMNNLRIRRTWPATQPLNADNCIIVRNGANVSIGVYQSCSPQSLVAFKVVLGAIPITFALSIAVLGAPTWLVVGFGFLAAIGALELTAENSFTIDKRGCEIRVTRRYLGFINTRKRLRFSEFDSIGYTLELTEYRRTARILALKKKRRVFLVPVTVSGDADREFANDLLREIANASGWTDQGLLR